MSGVVVSGYWLQADMQQLELDTSGGKHWDLTLVPAGAAQPTARTDAREISIGGRPGFYGYLSGLSFATQANDPIGLVWEYAPGAWATVVSNDQDAISSTDAVTVAEAVTPGRTQAVAVPIKVGTAPAGMHLTTYLGGPGGSRLGQQGTVGVNAQVAFANGSMNVSVDFARRVAGETLAGTKTTIAGRTAYVMAGLIAIEVDGNYIAQVSTGPSGPYASAAQLLAVANSLEFASNLQDQSTWFDATVALP